MARETWPAILMITSSPAPDSDSSVTSVWRLSCHRPFTPAFWQTLIHAVLKEVIRCVGSLDRGVPKPARPPDGPHSCPRCGNGPLSESPTVHSKKIERPCPKTMLSEEAVGGGGNRPAKPEPPGRNLFCALPWRRINRTA